MAKLYFYYAAMNAGKSTTLLQAAFNYAERGMATMLFTAAVDDRAGAGRIASRIGLEAEAIPFDATGKAWVRFAVWDSAGNGAFVQPVYLKSPPTTSEKGAGATSRK